MAKELKVLTVNSDGTPNPHATIPFSPIDPETGKPMSAVLFTLRPIAPEKWREIVRKHTNRVVNPKSRAMEEVQDSDGAQLEILQFCILGWEGVNGADGKPLPCRDDVKGYLDPELQNEIIQRARRAEAVEAVDASFRQPA